MSEKLPKGYECKACGKFHRFGAWVYAHTHVNLTHTCDCGQKHTIINCMAEKAVF